MIYCFISFIKMTGIELGEDSKDAEMIANQMLNATPEVSLRRRGSKRCRKDITEKVSELSIGGPAPEKRRNSAFFDAVKSASNSRYVCT